VSKDNRIFRITKQGYHRTTIQYKSRTAVSAMFARFSYADSRRPDILKVEAIDPADVQWEDVTSEFRDKPEPKCRWHKTYTGVRKPDLWSWNPDYVQRYSHGCTCAAVYLDKHPEYPRHDPLCSLVHMDPEQCSCRIITKLCE